MKKRLLFQRLFILGCAVISNAQVSTTLANTNTDRTLTELRQGGVSTHRNNDMRVPVLNEPVAHIGVNQSESYAIPYEKRLPEISTTVINEQPDGTINTYSRTGNAFQKYNEEIYASKQNGNPMDIVTASDGRTVYLKDIISHAKVGTWVTGFMEGNKIHVPLYQCIYYSEVQNFGFVLAKSTCVITYNDEGKASATYEADLDATEVTYTINDDGTISLDGTDKMNDANLPETLFSLIYNDNLEWSGYGDYMSEYYEFTETAKSMPENLEAEDWSYQYNDGSKDCGVILKVAIDEDRLYIQGLSENDPNSVVEGRIAGNEVSFTSDQYLGRGSGYILYFCGGKATPEESYDESRQEYRYTYIPELVMNYDAENAQLTSDDGDVLMINYGKGADEIYLRSVALNPRLRHYQERAGTPVDPSILLFTDVDWDLFGYNFLMLDIKKEDTEGYYLDPDKLYYILWVKSNGESKKFVFSADEYYSFAESGIDELIEVPYNFHAYDYWGLDDISVGGASICLYQGGFEDYGIQSVYYGGDERRESGISWYYGNPDGIGTIAPGTETTTAVSFFSIDGRPLSAPQKGINIVRMSDGSVRKVLIK